MHSFIKQPAFRQLLTLSLNVPVIHIRFHTTLKVCIWLGNILMNSCIHSLTERT